MIRSKTTFIKLTYAIVIFFTYIALAPFVFGQENTDETTPAERRAELQAEFEAKRSNIVTERQEKREELTETREAKIEETQEVREERRALLADRVQNRITNLAENMKNRMLSAIERLTQVSERIETRIEKLDELNVDTTEASSLLTEAQEALADAEANLGGLAETIEAAITSENPRKSWVAVKESFTTTRDLLKEAHQLIRGSVGALKAAVIDANLGRGVSDAVTDHTTEVIESDDEDSEEENTNVEDEESETVE